MIVYIPPMVWFPGVHERPCLCEEAILQSSPRFTWRRNACAAEWLLSWCEAILVVETPERVGVRQVFRLGSYEVGSLRGKNFEIGGTEKF
jgi:hypothetical protein